MTLVSILLGPQQRLLCRLLKHLKASSTYSVDPDPTAPVKQSDLGPHYLHQYLHCLINISKYMQQTNWADDNLRCNFCRCFEDEIFWVCFSLWTPCTKRHSCFYENQFYQKQWHVSSSTIKKKSTLILALSFQYNDQESLITRCPSILVSDWNTNIQFIKMKNEINRSLVTIQCLLYRKFTSNKICFYIFAANLTWSLIIF